MRLPKPERRVKAPKPLRRGKRPRPMRGTKRAGTKRGLRVLVRLAALERDGYRCQLVGFEGHVCGGEGLHGAHGFGKGAHPSVEFEVWNVIAICPAGHEAMGTTSEAWTWFLMERWGLGLYAERYGQACGRGRDLAEIRKELAA